MGVVYKAEDTKLGRTVALKFLATHLLHDEEAKQRFLREAKAAATLHHPNICTVHEIDEAEGKTFLAMAFLEGGTLEDRIAQGPTALKDVLTVGQQVAEGLQAAHAASVVHRDIKPANILISSKGRATIMDFGLARLTEASKLTRQDQTVGTSAYMSPEQFQGAEVDRRSDIWSLGCVLYEMVAGTRPFKGQYDQALAYEVIHEEPEPLTAIRAGVPMEIEILVGKCLAKDASDRYDSTAELAKDLRTLTDKLKSGRSTILRASQMTGEAPASTVQTLNAAATLPPDAVVTSRSRLRMLYAIAAVATLAFLAVTAVHFTETSPEQPVRRFSFSQPGLIGAAISPDGGSIAFVASTNGESGVWLRAIGSETARQIPGTVGARPALAWSPDSQSIVFATGGQVKRVAIDGGEALTLCDLPSRRPNFGFQGVTWSPDGERIVFSSAGAFTGRLYEIQARGGDPQVLVDNQSGGARWPHFLPSGDGPQALVYRLDNADGGRIMVLNLETSESSEIGPGGAAVYSRAGSLIHRPADEGEDGLFALPFSRARLQATGASFRIAEDGVGAGVAADGTLIYMDGVGSDRWLVWRDRSGAVLETVGQPQRDVGWPALSPDERRVAVASPEAGTGYDIWLHDLTRSTKTRLTFDPGPERNPAWSPSGDQIVYWLSGANGSSLMRKAADGTGEAVALVEAENGLPGPDWSHDGRYLVYQKDLSTNASRDVVYVEIGADGTAGEPVTFLGTAADEGAPKLSPDGRFVAYVSDESGRREVYVRPFPDGPGRWQASVDGGSQPRWSRDGKELLFVRDTTLLSASVATGAGVTLGQPQELFRSDDLQAFVVTPVYDVSADGQRILTAAPAEQGVDAAPPTIRVVQNWYEEFRDREGQ